MQLILLKLELFQNRKEIERTIVCSKTWSFQEILLYPNIYSLPSGKEHYRVDKDNTSNKMTNISNQLTFSVIPIRYAS